MELLDRIHTKLKWFKENSKNCIIEDLITVRDRLAVDSYDLALLCADSFSDYNGNYFMRKIQTAKKINELVKANTAVNKADNLAKEELEVVYETEMQSEALAHKLGLLLRQVNKVLDAMNQRISHMKKIQEEDGK